MSENSSARRMLCEDRSAARVLIAWAAMDGMAAGLEYQAVAGWPDASTADAVDFLAAQGVTHGLDQGAIEVFAAAIRGGRDKVGCVAARGTPPEAGRDGTLDFVVRPSSEEARYRHQPGSGRIDFRETNLVENALAGEGIAVEIPPRAGVDGTDVFGRPVRAPQGRPAKFRSGAGVCFDAVTRRLLAEVDGRVVWHDGVVSISGSYHVRGNVDYSVGNIAFVGETIVDGDVLDGFSVRSGRTLTVGGNLGACRADSEADLVVKGGVFGKNKARLRAKGSLSARFLNDCEAEAAGSVAIEREALNATLFTNRGLLMPRGVFAGGSASALGGADFDTLGSPMGILTKVAVGTDYNVGRRQGEIAKRVAEVDASVDKIKKFLAPLMTDRARMNRLLERNRAEVEKLVQALRDLRRERSVLAVELETLAETAARGAVRQINIRRMLHPGVLLEVGAVRHSVKRAVSGPASILEDRAQGTLRIVEFRELPTSGLAAEAAGS